MLFFILILPTAQDDAAIDRVRAEVRETPTTKETLAERERVLGAWVRRLLREGAPVGRAAPREEVLRVRELIDQDETDEACRLVDDLFGRLEEVARTASGTPIDLVNPTSGAKLWASVYVPDGATRERTCPAVVLVPGGLGFGSSAAKGRDVQMLVDRGFVVGLFDPDGRGKSEGKEDHNGSIHQDGLHQFLKRIAALEFVLADNVGVVSSSYGLALAAGALGRYPDDPPIRYLIDGEGPTDRFYITRNDDPKFLRVFDNHKTDEAEWWAEREAVRTIVDFPGAYLRVQHERDHVHGKDHGHAIDIIRAATAKEHGGSGTASWTRVNGAENPPNRVYTADDPPEWLPSGGAAEETFWFVLEMSRGPVVPREVRVPTSAAEVRIVRALPQGERVAERPEFREDRVAAKDGFVTLDVGDEPVWIVEGELPSERSAVERSPFGFHPASVGDRYDDAGKIGVDWDRGGLYLMWILCQKDPSKAGYDWKMFDDYFKKLPEEMRPLKNITPAHPEMARRGDVDVSKHLDGGSYRPADEAAYAAWVRAAVERYDGDGADDMPGLKVAAKHWQVDNEPPRGREGYADLVRITAKAIKEADPEATVLIGGLMQLPLGRLGTQAYEREYLPILKELNGEGFDIFDMHWFGNVGEWKEFPGVLARVKQDLKQSGFGDAPIWITEMGTYCNQPRSMPRQTEREQAAEMVKRHVVALHGGVEKVFWAWGMVEGFGETGDNDFFDNTGFVYDGKGPDDPGRGVRKVVYWSYRQMTGLLRSWDGKPPEKLDAGEGVHAYRFGFDGGGVTAVWRG